MVVQEICQRNKLQKYFITQPLFQHDDDNDFQNIQIAKFFNDIDLISDMLQKEFSKISFILSSIDK